MSRPKEIHCLLGFPLTIGFANPPYTHTLVSHPCVLDSGNPCRNECARDGAQSAWWKSTPGEAITLEVEGNCVVVRRGG
ncbi:MAG: hypothetical protein ACRESZ_07515, partial [Methylococcales bacterium]